MTIASLIRKACTLVVAYSSEVQFIIIMVGHSSMQADMVLEQEQRVLTS